MRSDIVLGGVVTDYELPDHTRTMPTRSELQADDAPVVTLRARPFPAATGGVVHRASDVQTLSEALPR